MSDEIKEKFYSLEELKRTIDSYDGYLDNEEVYYFIGTLRFAYDYITNLQEENERLNDKIYGKNEYIKMLEKSRDDYKSRCEKAISLLKEAGCYDEEIKTFCDDVWEELPELLNTLTGGDKE